MIHKARCFKYLPIDKLSNAACSTSGYYGAARRTMQAQEAPSSETRHVASDPKMYWLPVDQLDRARRASQRRR